MLGEALMYTFIGVSIAGMGVALAALVPTFCEIVRYMIVLDANNNSDKEITTMKMVDRPSIIADMNDYRQNLKDYLETLGVNPDRLDYATKDRIFGALERIENRVIWGEYDEPE